MKVLVVGGNGQIGSLFLAQIKESTDWKPVAMIRTQEQAAKFEKMNVPTVIGDLEWSVGELGKVVSGHDAVVFTAGSGGSTGPDKTLLIDLDGAVKMMEAAEAQNVSRFVIVSALGSPSRERWNDSLRPYYVAKHYADRALMNSSLDYTIVRPGGLLNEPGTGKIKVGESLERGSIPRADVAQVLIEVLRQPKTIGKSFDLVSGETAVSEAIATL